MKNLLCLAKLYTLPIFIGIYFITRLIHLTFLPIFTDESIYIYWAKLIATTHSQLFISLTDGKPPLLIWMMSIFLSILPQHAYLLAGRLPSVFAGCASVVGIWYVSGILFKSRKAQIIAVILYIINPFTLLYDRMALFDSLLQASMLWSVYFSLKTAATHRYKDAAIWGVILGIALLSKPTALIFVLLTPLAMITYATIIHKKFVLSRYVLLSAVAVVIAEVLNNLQRVSHVYYLSALKNSQFQQPMSELLKNPFTLMFGNLHGFYSWILSYYTIPFSIVVLIAFVYVIVKNTKIGLILLGLWFIPLLALATIGREIFPRYILFTTPYALLAVTYLLTTLLQSQKNYARYLFGILLLTILPLLLFSYQIITNPPQAPLPGTDYRQYVSDSPSGYGFSPIFDLINNQKKQTNVTVVTQGTFGLYPYAFNLEYWDDSKVKILPRWPLLKIDPDVVVTGNDSKVFVVVQSSKTIPDNVSLTKVLETKKPGGNFPITVLTLSK